MNKFIQFSYASVLREQDKVTFEDEGFLYKIVKSNKGYNINIFVEVRHKAGVTTLNEVSSGRSTGNAQDAIELMLLDAEDTGGIAS